MVFYHTTIRNGLIYEKLKKTEAVMKLNMKPIQFRYLPERSLKTQIYYK